MARQPRDYQLECKQAIRDAYARGKRGVAVELFTGAGKGFIIADIAKSVMEKGGRVLVLVNRDNLVDQLSESLIEQGMLPSRERGMDKASPLADLVVGSIPTMQKERLKKWNPNHFRLVITDEAHFAAASTFKHTLDYFEAAYHLFLSATIERHDKAGLWKGVEEIVFSMPLQKGIENGWLVPFEFKELPVPIMISDKEAAKKMWTEKDEENLFSTNEYLPRLFAAAAAESHGRKALFFWPNCDSSKEASEHFASQGIESRHVDGYMPKGEINDILEWFKSPGAKSLHNADLLSYGYDNPSIDTVGIMRLSRSIPMLKQRLGRGTRPACIVDGLANADERKAAIAASIKPRCLVLDLMLQLGDVKDKFADVSALITEDPAEKRFIREEARKAGRALTMEEIEGKLKAKRQTDKEKQLAKLAEDAANAAEAKRIAEERANKLPYIGDILMQHKPHHKPATPGHIRYIKSLGFKLPDKPMTGYQLMRIQDRFEQHQKQYQE